MSLHFIIDGYNLIKQAPRLDKTNLEDSRKALISLLSIYQPQGSKRNRVTVVYDGREGSFSASGSSSSVGIIFAQGESADDKIKRMVEKSENPRNVVVVTNDREIRSFVRQRGAQVITVEDFLAKCDRLKPKGKSEDKIIGPLEAAEINEEMKKIWLK
ncbi:hypothetical protein EPN16_05385 [bacterium]|nr:MAG: hypothetical protein EPN16_05385 [bacterium]